MKKLAVVLFSSLLFASCNQTKIGYADFEVIMKDYEGAKSLEAEYSADQQRMSQVLDSLSRPFQAKVQEFYKNVDKLSAADRAAQEQALQQEQQTIQAQQQQMQQILQAQSQERMTKLSETVEASVKEFAEKNGYEMIIATSASGTVLYGSDKLNVTDQIIEDLNEDLDVSEEVSEVEVETAE